MGLGKGFISFCIISMYLHASYSSLTGGNLSILALHCEIALQYYTTYLIPSSEVLIYSSMLTSVYSG
jgi:hypothetical protein